MFFTFSMISLFIISCYSSMVLPIDQKNITYTRIYYTSNKKATPKFPGNYNLFERAIGSTRNKPMSSTNIAHPTATSYKYTTPVKNWRDGEFKKQYEMIYSQWRKTKVFLEVEGGTPKLKQSNFTKTLFDLVEERNEIIYSPSQISKHSTPSHIEFYYSDETGDRSTGKHCIKGEYKPRIDHQKLHTTNSSFAPSRSNSPMLSSVVKTKHYLSITIPSSFDYEIKRTNTTQINLPEKENLTTKYQNMPIITESTTENDKIKFFEMYDKLTQTPLSQTNYNNDNGVNEIELKNDPSILLEHDDQSTHSKTKKHIVENYNNPTKLCVNSNETHNKPKRFLLIEKENTTTYVDNRSSVKLESKKINRENSYSNKSVTWSEYPFAAVYIYEPSQVHCDSVSISAHWLIASGTCLSRHKSDVFEGRSAFVSYCGDRWWLPGRVSYVKFTKVHPKYYPKDRVRKHLYNIGVIQVVTSMRTACSEWAPVSLMSHQFNARHGGSEALALGWGLDRYDSSYTKHLPKISLMIYEGLVFSDECPGNREYGQMKQFDARGIVSNVYCLSLPPYLGEDRDPVHGSLLLVGGKLVALYLQEERRPSGEQSAQYTGVWRLIPWVLETAKEPDETESVEI